MAEVVGSVADALLALAVVFVALLALRGWWSERAARTKKGMERQAAEEDARTLYALAALQGPVLLFTALSGGLLKLIALAWIAGRAITAAAGKP